MVSNRMIQALDSKQQSLYDPKDRDCRLCCFNRQKAFQLFRADEICIQHLLGL